MNSRLDTLQAVVLLGKLGRLDAWTNRRAEIAARYRDRLAGTGIRMPAVAPLARHAYHLLVVRVPARDTVRAELGRRGVQTGIHYPVPCHLQPPLARFAATPLPVAEQAAAELVSLPMFPHMTDEQVDYVCDQLIEVLAATSSGQELASVH